MLVTGDYTHDEWVQMIKTLDIADYRYDRYRTSGLSNTLDVGDDKDDFEREAWALLAETYPPNGESIVAEAETLAACVRTARNLVNTPANDMTPTRLADEAQRLGEAHDLDVDIFGPKAIREKGLTAFWNVAKGSREKPRFIVMRYKGNPHSDEVIALVGKGLTYDSGGYALKPGNSMATMFSDMSGSAAVMNAIAAIAQQKIRANVTAIVAACENMLSGKAYRNGDIIGSLAGKNIEITNTDAEGRLTLADAVTYAWQEEKATKIIDIATLTGAIVIALGDQFSGVVSDSDELWAALGQASALCGDNVWRLPNDDEFTELNKSERADIKNAGARSAGSIAGGLFIRAFAGERPWLHIDIAGTLV